MKFIEELNLLDKHKVEVLPYKVDREACEAVFKYSLLSESKEAHCLGVAKKAKRLSIQTGYSYLAEYCYYAGLLHDIGCAYKEETENHTLSGYKLLKSKFLDLYAKVALLHSLSIYQYNDNELYKTVNDEMSVSESLINIFVTAADNLIDGNGKEVTTEERMKKAVDKHKDSNTIVQSIILNAEFTEDFLTVFN